MIEKLNLHYSFTNPASIHDEEALTALELAGRQGAKINEVVADQNKLRTETEKHLDQQDTTIDQRMNTQDTTIDQRMNKQDSDIENIRTATVPADVKKEMQRRIDNGDFRADIDEYAGGLSAQLENLIANTPEGSTTMDVELLDIRTGANGELYATAGEAVRAQGERYYLPVVFNENVGKFLKKNTTSIATENEYFSLSDAIEIPLSINQVVIGVDNYNEYTGKAAWSTKPTLHSDFIHTNLGPLSPGEYTLDVPEKARYLFLASNTDGVGVTKGKPYVYIPKPEITKLIHLTGHEENNLPWLWKSNGNKVSFNFDTYPNHYLRVSGFWATNAELFSVSNAVEVTPGEVVVFQTRVVNPYTCRAVFQSVEGTNTRPVEVFNPSEPGDYMVIVPHGAKYLYVNSETDGAGKTHGDPVVYIWKENIAHKLAPQIAELVTPAPESIPLNLPDVFDLVVGDTFQLFTKGAMIVNNPYAYNFRVSCDIGHAYKRYFEVTPTDDNVGNHTLNIKVTNDYREIVAEKTVTLRVNPKATSLTLAKTILCVGDSLTANGIWVNEVHRRLTQTEGTPAGDGLTNITFIGSKNLDSVNYEATGGWSFAMYNGDNSPFYIGDKIDFTAYANSYGASYINYMPVLLGWNSTTVEEATYRQQVETFIDNVHSAFPACKIMLFSIPFPSYDGMGDNYGTDWNYIEKADRVKLYDQLYKSIAESRENVSYHNLSAQFDAENNYPAVNVAVNVRSDKTESRQNNGVHPSVPGSLQIADAVYRAITNKLLEG